MSAPRTAFFHIAQAKYLDQKGAEGGWLREWQHQMLKDLEDDPEKYKDLMPALVIKATAQTWGTNEPPTSQLDLFKIGGFPIDERLSFPDDTVPGGFRKVARHHATVFHLHESCVIGEGHLKNVQRRCEEKRRSFEVAFQRAGGNLTAKLTELADDGA